MTFEEFLEQSWNEHGTNTQEVATRLAEGFTLIQESSHIGQLATLLAHVYGQHLGQWDKGLHHLERLATHKKNSDDSLQTIRRSVAALHTARGDGLPSGFSNSDLVRVLSMAASATFAHAQLENAMQWIYRARGLAEALPKDDPAQRALASAANNLACALEEKASRSKIETDDMVFLARLALEKWSLVGNWSQLKAAYYRLAKVSLSAGLMAEALEHASACLEIAQENRAPALEMFWAYECLAVGERAIGNTTHFLTQFELALENFNKLKIEEKTGCESALKALRASIHLN